MVTEQEHEAGRFQDYKTMELRRLYQDSEAGEVDAGMGPLLELMNGLEPIVTTGCCRGHEEEMAYLAFVVRDASVWWYLQMWAEDLLEHDSRVKSISFTYDTFNQPWVRRIVNIIPSLDMQREEGAVVLKECAESVATTVHAHENGLLGVMAPERTE